MKQGIFLFSMKALIALAILVGVVLIITYADNFIGAGQCPKSIMGNSNASVKIKYFSSPLCIACWKQKTILTELSKEQGTKFYLEEYDVDFCRDAAAPHYIKAIPAFILDDRVLYGLQQKEQLESYICGGACT